MARWNGPTITKQIFLGTATLFVLVLVYSLGLARGHKQGAFNQWAISEALSFSMWNGTGEKGGFPGLMLEIDEEMFEEKLHPDGMQLRPRPE